MQPYTGTGSTKYGAFINVEHVKFIESGGARVVPIDFRLTATALATKLSYLDGIYIPGDSANVLNS